MSLKKSRDLPFEIDSVRVFHAFTAALPGAGVDDLRADPGSGTIQGRIGVTLRSWGEKLQIQVRPVDGSRSVATVTSSLRWGLIDWGKHKANLDAVEKAVRSALQQV